MSLKHYIERVLSGHDLTVAEASAALDLIMRGVATDAQIAGLLIALRGKGETVDELVGFAKTMREHSLKISVHDPDAVDIVGTGGDGLGTFNISTVAALVMAGAGVTVAKHGNRSVSSKCGSADLLSALGVNIQLSPQRVEECINTVGIGFLFAPLFHPAMKYAAKPRTELGVRTIFNLLGPITNPAGVRRHMIGAYASDVASKLSHALIALGAGKAFVVHNSEGMDEVGLSGTTTVFDIRDGQSQRYQLRPDDFGLEERPLQQIIGGDDRHNAGVALAALSGERGAHRDVIVANAALGIVASGKAKSVIEGTRLAGESIDSGRALKKLNEMIEFTGT